MVHEDDLLQVEAAELLGRHVPTAESIAMEAARGGFDHAGLQALEIVVKLAVISVLEPGHGWSFFPCRRSS
jgi:hypothetical protein